MHAWISSASRSERCAPLCVRDFRRANSASDSFLALVASIAPLETDMRSSPPSSSSTLDGSQSPRPVTDELAIAWNFFVLFLKSSSDSLSSCNVEGEPHQWTIAHAAVTSIPQTGVLQLGAWSTTPRLEPAGANAHGRSFWCPAAAVLALAGVIAGQRLPAQQLKPWMHFNRASCSTQMLRPHLPALDGTGASLQRGQGFWKAGVAICHSAQLICQ